MLYRGEMNTNVLSVKTQTKRIILPKKKQTDVKRPHHKQIELSNPPVPYFCG